MELSKKERIRLKGMIADLDIQIERLKIRRENYKKQLTLTDVVKQSEQFNCYEMHVYSRFDGCNKQCKECADNEKSKAI